MSTAPQPLDASLDGPRDFFVIEDPHHDGHDGGHDGDHHHETGTMLGFWVYLMSDSLIFGILFAVYAVVGVCGSLSWGPPGGGSVKIKMNIKSKIQSKIK